MLKGKLIPPYYMVTFISQLKSPSADYDDMAHKMIDLAESQPGFLGIESVRSPTGKGITISYWQSLESIKAWKENPRHKKAQKIGAEKWYENFSVQISKVDS